MKIQQEEITIVRDRKKLGYLVGLSNIPVRLGIPSILFLALLALALCKCVHGAGDIKELDRLPDLDVTFIERTPRYVPGPWVYPATGPQYMGVMDNIFTEEDFKGDYKQWPSEAEPVVFTVHVANKSDKLAPVCLFTWYLDDKKVASGKLPSIKPWQEVTQSYKWRWRTGAHTIGFQVDEKDSVKEICEKNNSLEDRTDASALQMRVTRELYEAWHTKPNGIGSYSFEDWVQRHIKIMNGVLAVTKYPKTAPDGILERVRVDEVVIMSKEEMQAAPPQRLGYDGGWNYYDDNFGKDNSWFDFHIKDDFVNSIDTGLIHELTHQIGIIDMYCIVVGAHWNHVLDSDGDPVMIGYRTKYPGMMGGGRPTVDFDGTVVPPRLFTPAQARTTWNEDWVVMACHLGDWSTTSKEEAIFFIDDFRITQKK